MSNKIDFFLLALIALVAIIGLVLMIQSASSGMVSASNKMFYEYLTYDDTRAVDVVGRERFAKAGHAFGNPIEKDFRKGLLPCTGIHPCEYPLRLTSWNEMGDKSKCKPVKEECLERYPSNYYLCCPLKSAN